MSKTTKNDVVENVETPVAETPLYDVDAIVKIVKYDDGFHCIQPDGSVSDVLKIVEDGRTLVLPKNPANRQYCAVKKAEAAIAESGEFVLTVRTTGPRTVGSYSNKMPNEKLISYLPEAEQEEYKAIMARAIAARDADREANKKPKTEKEKLQARIAKLKAQLLEMGVTEEEIADMLNNQNTEVENNG